jgi:DNA polymerase-3 subunit alpha
MEGYYYKPRVDWELLEKYSDGLIATTGCLGGHVLQALLQGDEKGALKKAGRLQDIFGGQPLRRAPGPRHPRAAPTPTRS